MWRNKPKENALQKLSACEEITKNDETAMKGADALLLIDKQREGDGWIGRVRMVFDAESQQFLDESGVARAVVPFQQSDDDARYGDDDYPEF